MTSVGYGDMLPNTYVGRGFALCMAIFGAFLLGLVVNVIAYLFDLEKNKKKVLCSITTQSTAATAIRHALQYNMLAERARKL
jgi:hypothetical protein